MEMRAAIITTTSVGIAAASLWLITKLWKDRRRHNHEWDKLLSFWFDGEGADLWFLKDDQRDAADELIRRKYLQLVEQCERGEKDWWANTGPNGCLALIIALDQFTRHVWRGNDSRIQKCGIQARQLTSFALEQNWNEIVRGDELSFLLMPYRHEKPVQMERLEQVLTIVDAREKRALKEKAVLSRFKRVTESRFSEARAEYEKNESAGPRRNFSDEDILEPHPHIDDDLKARLPDETRSPVYKVIERYFDQHESETPYVIVSLSGGVDSMVLMTILQNLVQKSKKTKQVIVAAHVDYGNRNESHAEADFVYRYSKQLGIQCYVHQIQGLLRGVTDREEYEEKSREIRFDLYKKIWREQLGQPLDSRPIVLFGHHEGDVVENVLSNSMKGKTILELSGMTKESIISGCIIRRPMLPLTKNHIFDYSHRFGVPYFKDTTPRWSTRGQVRLEVLPCLERVYGKGFQNHLAHLAAQSDDAFELLSRDFFSNRVISSNSLRENRTSLIAFAFDMTAQVQSKPLFLWRLALRKAAHDHGILIATDKAVKFLYEQLAIAQNPSKKSDIEGWFAELRKGSRGYIWSNRYLLVLRYEPEQVVPYDNCSAEALTLKVDSSPVQFGCWKVSVTSAPQQQEFIITMDDIWNMMIVETRNPLSLRYSTFKSSNELYVLNKSKTIIPSLQLDIPLRLAIIPQVFPRERISHKSQEYNHKVIVNLEWAPSTRS
jgi:tRNA(Ile)-lysidine synthetase-like protein